MTTAKPPAAPAESPGAREMWSHGACHPAGTHLLAL